jgi:hypothetical protein
MRNLGTIYMTLVFAEFAFCVSVGLAQSPQKLWTVDLSANADFQKRLSVFEGLLNAPSISFLNNTQIICDFYDGQRRGQNFSAPISGYHVLEIDTKTGAFGRKLDFQPADDDSRALPTDDGGFVVSTGKELKKFSREFVPGPSCREPRAQVNDRLLVDESPSRETILIYDNTPQDPTAGWSWLRAEDFTSIKSVQGPLTASIEASDNAAIFNGIGNRELLAGGNASAICARCDAYFITDDLLFIDKEKSYEIRTVDGRRQRTGGLNIQARNFSRALDVTRVAYVTGSYRGWGFPIQKHFDRIIGRIIVLDWSTNEEVGEIEVNESILKK